MKSLLLFLLAIPLFGQNPPVTGTTTINTVPCPLNGSCTLSGAGSGNVTGAGTNTAGGIPAFTNTSSTAIGPGSAHNISLVTKCPALSASGTAYTCSTTQTFTPVAGDSITFIADIPSTGTSATLAVNGASAAGIKIGGSTTLSVGQIQVGMSYTAYYDGTYWQLSSSTPGGATAGIGIASGSTFPSGVNTAYHSMLENSGVDPSGTNDSTVGIKAMLAAYPQASFLLPPGTYKVTSHITLDTRRQSIIGQGTFTTTIDCSGLTGSDACIVETTTPTNNTTASGGLRDLALSGPSKSGTAIGLYLGGDPSSTLSPSTNSAFATNQQNLYISGFGVGEKFGNLAWDAQCFNCLITNNGQGIYFPGPLTGSGESSSYFGGTIFNNTTGVQEDGNATAINPIMNFFGTRFDYNNVAITGTYALINLSGAYFEMNYAGPMISVSGPGSGVYSFVNSEATTFNESGTSGTLAQLIFASNSYVNFSISGGYVYAGGTTLTAFVSGGTSTVFPVAPLMYTAGVPLAASTYTTLLDPNTAASPTGSNSLIQVGRTSDSSYLFINNGSLNFNRNGNGYINNLNTGGPVVIRPNGGVINVATFSTSAITILSPIKFQSTGATGSTLPVITNNSPCTATTVKYMPTQDSAGTASWLMYCQ